MSTTRIHCKTANTCMGLKVIYRNTLQLCLGNLHVNVMHVAEIHQPNRRELITCFLFVLANRVVCFHADELWRSFCFLMSDLTDKTSLLLGLCGKPILPALKQLCGATDADAILCRSALIESPASIETYMA